MNKTLKRIIPILFVLILWIICSNFINPLFLPDPKRVLNSFIDLAKNGMLQKGIIYSFTRITVATFLSAIVSLPIGLLIINYKVLDDIITPITNFMRYLPATAFYPLLMLWVGIEETMKITFIFMATFFYFLPSVILCLKEVNSDLIDTALTIGMSRLEVLYKVILPSSLPSICQTFLMMYGIGWTYVVIAETINATYGLGHLINVSSSRGRTDMVFVSLITILIISYIFDNIGNFLIRKSFKWKFAREMQD